MPENRDYLEMPFKSITCFSDDGKLDFNELNRILDIAPRDGVVDDNEARVVDGIMSRITPEDLNSDMQVKATEIREKYLS